MGGDAVTPPAEAGADADSGLGGDSNGRAPGFPRRARRRRPAGFVAFLDVVFASVGVFIAVIVIQAALIRTARPPSEADLYAALRPDGQIVFQFAPISPWKELGLADSSDTLPPQRWVARLRAIAAKNGVIRIEIAHGAATAPLRRRLGSLLADADESSEPGAPAAFIIRWRPLADDEDPNAYPARRADAGGGDAP